MKNAESKLEQAAAKYANEFSEGEGYADYHDRKMGFIAGANWQSLTTPAQSSTEEEKDYSLSDIKEHNPDYKKESGEGGAVDGWISVDSAPKDGTSILGYDPNTEEIYVVRWNQFMGNGCWNNESNNYIPRISHHKLLPKPPIK